MKPVCRKVRPSSVYDGKQGFSYLEGVASETVGSTAICMHLLTIMPGGRGKAHKHEGHETAVYVVSGEASMWYGDRLEEFMVVHAGEFLFIPAGVPHLPANQGKVPCTAIISRTDPREQESVVLLPELEQLVAA